MNSHLGRLYQADRPAEAVHVEFASDRVKVVGKDIFAYYNGIRVELGGHSGTKLKISPTKADWAIILDQAEALEALTQAAAGTALAPELTGLTQKLKEHPSKERKYWTTVLTVIAALIVVSYLSLEGLVQLAVNKIDPTWEMRFADLLSHNEHWSDQSPSALRVRRVGSRLVAAQRNNPYNFRYFADPSSEVNAYALPGGLVVVNQGLLEKANDDELAGVLAHEIGHVMHRDSLRQVVHSLGLSAALSLVIGATGSDRIINIANVTGMAEKLENLNYSRQQEADADKFGVRLAVDADFRGAALMEFFAKLKDEEPNFQGNRMLSILSNHPMTEDRITAIRAELERLKEEHHKS
jgi:Zn-dependent protease with chaperone function